MSKQPHGAKSAAEPKLLIFKTLQWLGLDSAGPRLIAAIKRLDCAPASLLSASISAQVRSCRTYLDYPASDFLASAATKCDFLRVAVHRAPCKFKAC